MAQSMQYANDDLRGCGMEELARQVIDILVGVPHSGADPRSGAAAIGAEMNLISWLQGTFREDRRVRCALDDLLADVDATGESIAAEDFSVLLQSRLQKNAVLVAGLQEILARSVRSTVASSVVNEGVVDRQFVAKELPALNIMQGNQYWPVENTFAWWSDKSRSIGRPSLKNACSQEGGRIEPVWQVPFRKKPCFVGRARELAELRAALMHDQAVGLGGKRALTGFGGIGKTTLAAEYAHVYRDSYVIVGWIRAAQSETILEDFSHLARMLGLNDPAGILSGEDTVQEVLEFLAGRNDWLLVFANAPGPGKIAPFLPFGGRGHVLVTSCQHVWPGMSTVNLGLLPLSDAAQFLQDRTGETNLDVAYAVAKELDCLPLALEQAAATIYASPNPNLCRYLDRLQRSRSLLPSRLSGLFAEQSVRVPELETVEATFATAFEEIAERHPLLVAPARELLDLCAWLAPDAIPRSLFTTCPEWLPSNLSVAVKEDEGKSFDAVIDVLMEHSLFRAVDANEFSIHQIVQTILRTSQDTPVIVLEQAIDLVAAVLPDFTRDDPTVWPTWKEFASHLCVLADHAHEVGAHEKTVLSLRHQLARYYANSGDYAEALVLGRAVLKALEGVLGPEHPHTLATRHQVAFYLGKTGAYDEALVLGRVVLEVEERVLGPEHPHTLATRYQVVLHLGKTGAYDEALVLGREVLEARERVLGPDDPHTLMSRYLVALYLDRTGAYVEALVLGREVLKALEKVWGPDDLYTLMARHQVALYLGGTGAYDEALVLGREVLEARERVLGSEHPHTLMSRYLVAFYLDRTGACNEALVLGREVLEARERVLGPEHPHALAARHQVAFYLDRTGAHDEALVLARAVLEVEERVLGPEHPHTLATRYLVAFYLGKTGACAEALVLGRAVLEARERVLGPEHLETLASREMLVFHLGGMRSYREALALGLEVLELAERVWGPEDPRTLMTRHQVAFYLGETGSYREALVLGREVLEARERVLRPEHSQLLVSREMVKELEKRVDEHEK